MEIIGKLKGIRCKPCLATELETIELKNFDINKAPSACIVNDGKNSFAISKWVSPKPSRTYPYRRVYNTLNISKKITVIPIVKDEGYDGDGGDRDYLQWDSISFMSLMDVYVILAYYEEASKHRIKIKSRIKNLQMNISLQRSKK